ncbi:MAG: SsrA-binding protein [Candidatus Levybacteria bacterium RBG_16_35_11]|nr:MAG: SsrA-binding protein [Candidatus Levybacteria bacterium RBG_16_35_11]
MKVVNRRARFDYQIQDKFEAGINLLGPEVKAVRLGQVDLLGSHVKIVGSEAYLINSRIYPYRYANLQDYDEKRTRKLLLHKKEIISLKSKLEGEGLSLIPLSIYTSRGFIKVELALAKGKKKFQKRESIKKKDIQRQVEEEAFGNN